MKSRTYLTIVLVVFALVIAGVLLHGIWDTAAGTGNGM
jgi:FtsZ-interacting cell division protein ZipA